MYSVHISCFIIIIVVAVGFISIRKADALGEKQLDSLIGLLQAGVFY